MKKKFLIFFICFLFFVFSFSLTKAFLNRFPDDEKTKIYPKSDLKEDSQRSNEKEITNKEFKSDEVSKNFHYFEIIIFFLAPVCDFLLIVIDFKKNKKNEKEKFCQLFTFYYLIFSFVIAELIINHLGKSLVRYVKSKKTSFLTIFKNSLKSRLRVITLVFLLVHLVFFALLFWIAYIIIFE